MNVVTIACGSLFAALFADTLVGYIGTISILSANVFSCHVYVDHVLAR